MRLIFLLLISSISLTGFSPKTIKPVTALKDGIYMVNRLVMSGQQPGILSGNESFEIFPTVFTENKISYTGAIINSEEFAAIQPAAACEMITASNGAKEVLVKLVPGSGDITVKFIGVLPRKPKQVPRLNGIVYPVTIQVKNAGERIISFSGGTDNDMKKIFDAINNKFL